MGFEDCSVQCTLQAGGPGSLYALNEGGEIRVSGNPARKVPCVGVLSVSASKSRQLKCGCRCADGKLLDANVTSGMLVLRKKLMQHCCHPRVDRLPCSVWTTWWTEGCSLQLLPSVFAEGARD